MNMKIIGALVIVIIAALAVVMFPKPEISQQPETETQVSEAEATVDETYILEEMYLEMLNEEMDSLNIEQTSFNEEIQDSMASDLSQFYYQ